MSSEALAGLVAATCAWIICIVAYNMETPRRPSGEAWVVTSSDKMPSRPMLVRANVPSKTATHVPLMIAER
jgi:hypothetical protein